MGGHLHTMYRLGLKLCILQELWILLQCRLQWKGMLVDTYIESVKCSRYCELSAKSM